MGARIVLVARDKVRADATVARLRESGAGIAHSVHFADLLRLAEIKRVAAQIADSEPRIDILINNAGAMFASRRLTEDGLECTFALNHMAYFVLTQGLRERLSASGPARIINTASGAHRGASLDFDDLQSAKSFGAMKAYGPRQPRSEFFITRPALLSFIPFRIATARSSMPMPKMCSRRCLGVAFRSYCTKHATKPSRANQNRPSSILKAAWQSWFAGCGMKPGYRRRSRSTLAGTAA
jgi:NAD(P)-dependent dehydrogenase (short-subunit alcohol dehydrogenase family)